MYLRSKVILLSINVAALKIDDSAIGSSLIPFGATIYLPGVRYEVLNDFSVSFDNARSCLRSLS